MESHQSLPFTYLPLQLCNLQPKSQSTVLLAACLMTEDAIVFIKPAYTPFIFSLEAHFYRQS